MLLTVTAETIPEAWEQAVIKCWEEGTEIATEYDKPGDPPSRDCTLAMCVTNPMKEPRIHRAFPAGLNDLEKYRLEVTEGVHDHWINPEEGKWSYTYHQRFWAYPYWGLEANDKFEVVGIVKSKQNQIGEIITQLANAPHTRRAQAITWIPQEDQYNEHCACLQRLWFRIFDNKLQMDIHIRSNDAYKAGFMNMWAFVDIQRIVAEEVTKLRGEKIEVGEYIHFADSWHIYGSYFEEFKQFLDSVKNRTFEERVWRSDEDIVQDFFEQGRQELRAEREKEQSESTS